MNNSDARKLMQTAFLDALVFPTALVALDNQTFEQPSDDTSWCRLAISFNTGRQDTLGIKTNRKFKKMGILTVQVFTISDGATNINDGLVQDSLDVFEGENLSGVYFVDGRIRTVGTSDKWYQQNAVLEFNYHEIK